MLIIPRTPNVTNFKYIQFSRHDTVRDLYVRLLDSVGTSNFRLWKLENQTESFESIFNDIKTQYETTKRVYINGEQIESSTANVMTLNLDADSLLIIEKLPMKSQEFAFRSTLNTEVETKDENSKT